MKEFFKRLSDYLKAHRKNLAVFVPSFLLAFSIWCIHNVSLRYSEILSANVVARSTLEGRRELSSNSCTVTARCRATGYTILGNKAFGSRRKTVIVLPESALHHRYGDVFAFVPESMPEFGNMIFGSSVSSVEHYLTDTLYFEFHRENNRKVPVHFRGDYSFAPQYMSVKGVEMTPDSVLVYGEPSVLEGISFVNTGNIVLPDLRADRHGTATLETPAGTRLSQTSADYSIGVQRYVSSEILLDVAVKGRPAGKSIAVFPSSVKAKVNFRFPLVTSPDSLDVAYVDYAEFEKSKSGKCIVRISGLPEGVLSIDLENDIVDCIAE